MRRIFPLAAMALIAAGFVFTPYPDFTQAQNVLVPTRPAGDSTNAAASTAFTQNAASNPVPPVSIAIGGCTPSAPPTQNAPVSSSLFSCGSYADSTTGNIFQISSWADNTGTRPTVALFGQGRAQGTNARAWGVNGVAYAGGAGAFAQNEYDFGVSSGISNQQAWGLSVNAAGCTNCSGGTGNVTIGLNFDSLGAGGTYSAPALRFNNAGLAQPYSSDLIATGNAGGAITAPSGINFTNANFATAAIRTNGFTLGPTGTITSGVWNGTTVAVANGGTGDTGTAWSAFTPSPSCGTATFTVNTARSKTLGKTTWIDVEITFTALGSCTTGVSPAFSFTLPNTSASNAIITGREIQNNAGMVACTMTAAGSTILNCAKQAGALVNWTGTDHLIISGVYENQ